MDLRGDGKPNNKVLGTTHYSYSEGVIEGGQHELSCLQS